LRAELAWAGFGEFTPGTWARPARADEALARLAALLDDERALTVFAARDRDAGGALAGGSPIAAADFGATLASRAPAVWELGSLAADYRHFLARFGSVVEALRRRPEEARDPAQTFAVRTLLVHEYRRVRLRDPQLPAALLPPDWPGAAAYALARAFYRLARPAAEAHLERAFAAGGENLAPALPEFLLRFPDPG
jgi:phenylacetic acid degradation operon negative regulatory protein